MGQIRIPRIACGITAFDEWVDLICEKVEQSLKISTTGIISATMGKAGVHLHVPDFPIGLGITTGTIAARVGTTIGIGTADLKLLNVTGTTLAILADPARTNQKVYNFSASGTIVSGKYFLWVKIQGFYFIVATEC